MSTLDRVLQLQAQGMQDTDIIRILREENIPPLEINNSLNQAKVKSAVSSNIEDSDSYPSANQFSGMEQSLMGQEDISPMQETTTQPISAPQDNYDQNYSPQYYPQTTGMDAETISEIAEQIVIEKLEEFTQRTGDLVSFRNEVEEKIKNVEEKIKRIESSLDKIQEAIIKKVGEYGDNLNFIKKDMNNLHETMSKMMNPLIDNYMELKKFNQQKSSNTSE